MEQHGKTAEPLHDCNRNCPSGHLQGDPGCRQCHDTMERLSAAVRATAPAWDGQPFRLPDLRGSFPSEYQAAMKRTAQDGAVLTEDLETVNRRREEAGYEPLEGYLPRVVGNALICSDGTCHQMRLLEKLYFRCGILSVRELDRKYRGGEAA